MGNDPAADTVTLVVAVAGFVVVAQWWLARRFARGAELRLPVDHTPTIGPWRQRPPADSWRTVSSRRPRG
jgi:hypothetical protein